MSSATPPSTLAVDGKDLPPPTTRSEHILVIGDTGCRIKSGDSPQDCSGLQNEAALQWLHVGHIHFFEHFDANSGHQAETITGGSGTSLDPCSSSCSGACYCFGGTGNYSYLRVESQTSSWEATLYNLDGDVEHQFSVSK